MELSTNIFSTVGDVSPLQARAPLIPRLSSPTNSTQLMKQIRRKGSFIIRADSSEELPSPHESIFEAFYISTNNSDESNNRIEMVTLRERDNNIEARQSLRELDENNTRRLEPLKDSATYDSQFLYGHGTVLETITERRSCGTIRTITRTKSVDDMPNFPFLGHRDSFILAKSPRRKHSFSLDDLALIKSSYHEALGAIAERDVSSPLKIDEIYAQPRTPIHAPLERPPTPEGMPSWTASQAISRPLSRHQPGTPNRFQRFFGLPASGITHSSRLPLPNSNPRDRSASAPVRGRVAPRFRPPRSAYIAIDQHPFNNAPIAKAEASAVSISAVASGSTITEGAGSPRPKPKGKRRLGQRVRFTPSATARDSELNVLQTAIESTTASALHPISSIQAQPVPAHWPSRNTPTEIKCPHRKGRHATLKALKGIINRDNTAPLSNEHRLLQSYSPTCPNICVSIVGPSPDESPARPDSLAPILAQFPNVPSGESNAVASTSADNLDTIGIDTSRNLSISSTSHLISSFILSRSPTPKSGLLTTRTVSTTIPNSSARCLPRVKRNWCWKCKLQGIGAKLDQWWMQSASCLCFVCCGFDIDDNQSVECTSPYGGSGTSSYGMSLRGGGFQPGSDRMVGPRRVVLESTPVVGL